MATRWVLQQKILFGLSQKGYNSIPLCVDSTFQLSLQGQTTAEISN